MASINHFGSNVRIKEDGIKLTGDNYVHINNRSSFGDGKTYSDKECNLFKERALINYDLNMNYFKTLNTEEFNNELDAFLSRHSGFKEVFDLRFYKDMPGYYIVVLDEYNQVYIGTSKEIKKRIMFHWARTFPLDRLVFGTVSNSVLIKQINQTFSSSECKTE